MMRIRTSIGNQQALFSSATRQISSDQALQKLTRSAGATMPRAWEQPPIDPRRLLPFHLGIAVEDDVAI